MKKKLQYFLLLLLGLIVVITAIVKELWVLNKEKKQNDSVVITDVKKKNFKSELLENIVDSFKNLSNKEELKLDNFSLVKYDNKTYFKIEIPELKNSTYLIHYEGINVATLHANILEVNEKNMPIFQKAISILIQVSDKSIKREEALQILSELLTSLNKNKSSVQIKYINGLVYTIEVKDDKSILFTVK